MSHPTIPRTRGSPTSRRCTRRRIALGLERVRAVYERLAIALRARWSRWAAPTARARRRAFLERCSPPRGLSRRPLHLAAPVALQRARAHRRRRCRRRRAAARPSPRSRRRASDTPLTYFEFTTLAALWLFARARLDAVVLEVGLGGRLDAVNIVDADVRHRDHDRDRPHRLPRARRGRTIAREKAGIFRAGRAAICADRDPPAALIEHAQCDRRANCCGSASSSATSRRQASMALLRAAAEPATASPIRRCAAPTSLRTRRPRWRRSTRCASACRWRMGAVREALVGIELPGRFQVLPGRPVTVLDVAHNEQAARALCRQSRGDGLPSLHATRCSASWPTRISTR